MATYTAGDQINRALRLLGVLAEGETPSASESNDALTALNQMLDSWGTESLAVFTSIDQAFTWPASTASRTLGPTGDFVGPRPVDLDESTYFTVGNVSYPVTNITYDQYTSITAKNVTSSIPQFLCSTGDFPNTTIYLYPVPTQALLIHFISNAPLAQPTLLSTVLSFPPGYLRAFAYNLALEIAPEFGIEPSKDVRRIATISKRNLKRINSDDNTMTMPYAIPLDSSGSNIFSGQ